MANKDLDSVLARMEELIKQGLTKHQAYSQAVEEAGKKK